MDVGTAALSAVFTPTDTADFNSVTDTVSIAVTPVPLSVKANDAIRAYGQTNPRLYTLAHQRDRLLDLGRQGAEPRQPVFVIFDRFETQRVG